MKIYEVMKTPKCHGCLQLSGMDFHRDGHAWAFVQWLSDVLVDVSILSILFWFWCTGEHANTDRIAMAVHDPSKVSCLEFQEVLSGQERYCNLQEAHLTHSDTQCKVPSYSEIGWDVGMAAEHIFNSSYTSAMIWSTQSRSIRVSIKVSLMRSE
jgi:hypothetical protein